MWMVMVSGDSNAKGGGLAPVDDTISRRTGNPPGRRIYADDLGIGLRLRKLLAPYGYEVLIAPAGPQAWPRLAVDTFALAFLNLATLRAAPACAWRGGNSPTPVVIILPPAEQAPAVGRRLDRTAVYYLYPPFGNEHLMDLVDYLIGDGVSHRPLAHPSGTLAC